MSDNSFENPAIAVAYQSGFGHTATLAGSVAAGARAAGARVSVVNVEEMTNADWDTLDGADGIVWNPRFSVAAPTAGRLS